MNNIQDSTTVTFSKVYGDIKASLNSIGAALKVSVEHVYGVLVKQQLVDSISNIIQLLILLFAATIILIVVNKGIKKEKNKYRKFDLGDHEGFIAGIVVSVILYIWFLIALISTFNDIVTGFVNPEYGALREILNHIK